MKKFENRRNYLGSKEATRNECRVCFQKQAILTSLSQSTSNQDLTELVKNIIPQFKIFAYEAIKSKQICNLCLEIVINTNELKRKCAESVKKLSSRGPDNPFTDPYCRICLKETDDLNLILNARSGYSILCAINSFCSPDIQYNDRFSQEICYDCTDVLEAARHCAMQNNKLFRRRRKAASPSSSSGAPSPRIHKVESAAQDQHGPAINHEEPPKISSFTLHEYPKVPFNSKVFGCDMCNHVYYKEKHLSHHKYRMHNTIAEEEFKRNELKCYVAKRPAEPIAKPPAKVIRSRVIASSTPTDEITLPSVTLADNNSLTRQMKEPVKPVEAGGSQ